MNSASNAALPTGAKLWITGARPKTLPAAMVPVAVGTAAVANDAFTAWRAIAAMIVALALQVATNYANDYSDGIRGTDDDRVGPLRLVGSGAASSGAVKKAMFVSFAVAGLVGLALSIAVNPLLLVVGAASIAAGWFYTGGSNPYGYIGLGEVFVFVFFGVVATVGSAYVQTESLSGVAAILSIPVGVFATALLVINNLRDRVGDAEVGKRTLAVRIGDRSTRWLYIGSMVGAFVLIAVVGCGYGPAAVTPRTRWDNDRNPGDRCSGTGRCRASAHSCARSHRPHAARRWHCHDRRTRARLARSSATSSWR